MLFWEYGLTDVPILAFFPSPVRWKTVEVQILPVTGGEARAGKARGEARTSGALGGGNF
jgi:hypothetical protein